MINYIYDNIDIIGLIFSALSLLISSLIYFITYRTYNAQLEQIKKQNLPNLKILSTSLIKSDPSSSSINDGSYCRISKGETSSDISIGGSLATFKFTDSNIEPGFIDEIESTMNKKVYFTYVNGKPYLVANHATSTERYIIDHSNAKITFHNYGSKISTLSIEKLIIYYKPEMNIKTLTLKGNPNNKITLTPEENEEFELYFDEVTTDLNNSTCQLPKSIYDSMIDSFNLLRSHMTSNFLSYNKLEIYFMCWDMYNLPQKYLITLEYNGNFFTSSTIHSPNSRRK